MIRITRAAASLAAITAGALVLAGCSAGDTAESADSTLRIGTVVEPTSWALPEYGQFMPYFQAVYDTVLRYTPDGEYAPMLAEEWSYNDDSTVLTLDLRDDAVFSDGEPVDAQSVADSLVAYRDSSAADAGNLANLADAVVVDDDTLELQLSQPEPALFYYLSTAAGMITSQAARDGDGSEPVGSGPYRYDAADSVNGSVHVFTATPDYWDPELQQFDRLELRVYTDPTATVNALRSGQIDGSLVANASDVGSLVDSGFTDNVVELDWQGIAILDRTGSVIPELGDVRVRQAINQAVDGDAILEAIAQGRGTPTTQIFGPSIDGYLPELEERYPFDVDAARELLADAGYADGFTVPMPRIAGVDGGVFTTIEQNLADIGITVQYSDVNLNEWIDGVIGGQYPITWFQGAQSETWRQLQENVVPGGLWNALGEDIPEIDALIERVRLGETAAAEEINEYVVENAWFDPWFRMQSSYMTSDAITVEVQAGSPVPSLYNYRPAA